MNSRRGSETKIERFRRARRDRELTVLEGLHPLKHALRFGADVMEVLTADRPRLERLAAALAPDVAERVAAAADAVPGDVFERLAPHPPSTGVIAIARRDPGDPGAALGDPSPAPVVLLDRPRHLGNLGAVVRVAAAAEARAVLTTGEHDPWHPAALRGSAGLHYAVPVARVAAPPRGDRPLVAVDPEGEPLRPGSLPDRALLAFGSERHGLDPDLSAAADRRVRIPMRAGVSSLNLATAAAVVLYSWRLAGRPRG